MSKLTRDGTAEPVSRDQILRRERGQGNVIFSVQLTTSRIGNLTRLIHILAICVTIHTYIMVTTRYSNQKGSISRQNPLAKSNQPRTSETYRRQDDVFGIQFLLSGVLPVFHNVNY